ncbi:MAG: AlpA family phage regulatory protein [Atribacterota bacterium]|jgi:prophage regulatory protein|nr:AlpA family phage regulatory protein [Atribacterota bacterium]
MNTNETTRPHRLIRFPEVKHKSGLCRTAIYTRIANGDFPAPRKLGRVSVWVEAEIDRWISDVAGAEEGGNR